MTGHSSITVANRILTLARKKGIELTPMQLQKLVYIAHGWSLAILNSALTKDDIEAWTWGPVYPRLYHETKRYGRRNIDGFLEDDRSFIGKIKYYTIEDNFSKDEDNIIEHILKYYGDLHAFQLSALTHNEGTPWTQIYKEKGEGVKIPDDLIKGHFNEIAGK